MVLRTYINRHYGVLGGISFIGSEYPWTLFKFSNTKQMNDSIYGFFCSSFSTMNRPTHLLAWKISSDALILRIIFSNQH